MLLIAEKENKSNMGQLCNLLFGMVDVCSLILIILPLYPNELNGFIYSVNLFAYTQTTRANRLLYWIMYILLILMGIIKVSVTKFRIERYMQIITGISMVLSIMMVLILAITREAYALIVVFLLLVIKGVLILSLQSK